ncbi:MAG: hypothetical protein ACR2JQ_01310, partial [Mycobacteriales bacterium]
MTDVLDSRRQMIDGGPATDPVTADLAAGLPVDAVITDPDIVSGYRHDMAAFAPSEQPRRVVLPRSTAEVQH